MNKYIVLLIIALAATNVEAKVNVVASTADLKSIADFIGGENVFVKSIATGKSNPHFIEVLPSYMVMVSKADLYLKVGLDLDIWAQPIIDGSRNGKLVILDCSAGIIPLEKPTSRVDASMGDVHPQGNPHYWLDPRNAVIIARNIETGLTQIDPANSANYRVALGEFEKEISERMASWNEQAKPIRGLEIITFHNSWPYFAQAFGINVAGFVEPKPGIEPTPSHTAMIIELVKSHGIIIIGKEPYFSERAPKVIATATGAKIIDMPPSVGGADGAGDYFSLIDTLISRLKSAAGKNSQ
jgi:ABC-type Zn uptake system ZnuABC Zn-binding protein ZnuA